MVAAGPTKGLAVSLAKAAGAKATALPFTATADTAGALSSVNITFPKADRGGKDLKYNVKVTEIGGTVSITVPPKNKMREAPSNFYTGP